MDQEIIGPACELFLAPCILRFLVDQYCNVLEEASFSTPSGSGDDFTVVRFLFAVPFLASKRRWEKGRRVSRNMHSDLMIACNIHS